MSFCSHSYFPPTIVVLLVSLSTFSYFLFLLHFLFCPVHPLPKSCWACPLQRTSFYIPISFSSMYSFPSSISLSRTFHVCPALPLPKSCWACPLQVPPPAYVLPFTPSSRTSLYCGFSLVDFTCIVCVMRLFLPFLFYLDFPENFIYILTIFFIDLVLVVVVCYPLWWKDQLNNLYIYGPALIKLIPLWSRCAP